MAGQTGTQARNTISLGRVIWIIWCLAWAGFWATAAALDWPHHGCTEPMLVVTNGSACAQYGTLGNTVATVMFLLAAVMSVLAARIPVGRTG
jgi:hypothetical protein